MRAFNCRLNYNGLRIDCFSQILQVYVFEAFRFVRTKQGPLLPAVKESATFLCLAFALSSSLSNPLRDMHCILVMLMGMSGFFRQAWFEMHPGPHGSIQLDLQ